MTFDIHAALPSALADRAGAWEFIRAFAADRSRPIGASDGYDPAELDASAARLGVPLPIALRELYELVGRRADLTSNHDVLLPPDKLYIEDGVLVFREENQGVAWWGIRPGGDDPAVIASFSLAEPDVERECEDPGNRVRWFAGPDLLARYDGGMILVRARTEEDLERFFDAVCGEDEDGDGEEDGRDG